MTDPIADMLTRIRNAIMAKKAHVEVPFSKLKFRIAEILSHEGWVNGITLEGTLPHQSIGISLKYDTAGKPVLTHIKRMSTVGKRMYVKRTKLPRVLNDFGIAIVTTPQGVMTDREARKRGIGGEVLCEIY